MKYYKSIKRLAFLLSVLLAASTASVRSSLAASAPAPEPSPAPSQAAGILNKTCQSGDAQSTESAAYAAEILRYEAGYISAPSQSVYLSAEKRLNVTFSAAKRLMRTMIAPDWSGWQNTLVRFEPAVYDSYALNVKAFQSLANSLDNEIQLASADCARGISRELREAGIPIFATGKLDTTLNWKECAALYYVFGDDFSGLLADSLAVEREGNANTGVSLNWPNPTFEDIAAKGTHDQLVEAVLALDYFNTVYNDDGTTAPIEQHIYSKEYLATVAHPVPGGVIKDGWYDPRSRRTRLHVGTDIRMPKKTPILSATDGMVKYIGYLPIPGNYVIIQDPYGYTYHYYHMLELTTFVKEGDTVKQGQQIGIVGSTGNSVAYHLHVGLVSPEGKYLNPYDLFVQAGIGPILGD